jgi:RNA polymerase sigma factor (sigma-70 family)
MIQFSTAEKSARDRQRTLQAVFESQYAWLLRWALHFTENDRAAAEDLVQETFVRLLLAWDTLRDLDDLEPLLYSYLRYTHLSEQRRSQKRALERLSSADFDTLSLSLRSASNSSLSSRSVSTLDQIEVQNELRSILDFLLWRKQSARFASIFLLRFFHGYFPEEIASICIAKRFAVDLGLRQARRELKSQLADPHRLHVLGRTSFRELKPNRIAVPMEQFEQELRLRMFQPTKSACLSREEFDRIYSPLNRRGMETAVLSHVVTCEQCLENASRRCGAPPPSARSMDDSLSRAPRGMSKKVSALARQQLARIFAAGEDRMREIYEHHPAELMIALNAKVVAVRDVAAGTPHAALKVETHSVETLEIIEIFSENGLLLLSMPLTTRPPKSPPEIRHVIRLSDDRTLSLVVRFMPEGALIEAIYDDPQGVTKCEDVQSDVTPAIEIEDVEGVERSRSGAPTDGPPDVRRPSRVRHLLAALRSYVPGAPTMVPGLLPAAAIIVGLILFLALSVEERQQQRTDANQLLRAAARAESLPSGSSTSGAILQLVQIKASGRATERSLYRDPTGKRRAKNLPLNEDERILRMKFAEAKLDWDDPLSAQGFRDWHDHLYREEDRVTRSGQDLLTVSTRTNEGAIAEESLTVERSSFHAVARSVHLRDGETVEIAELNYKIVPWEPQVEQWFEPLSGEYSTDSLSAPVTHAATVPMLTDVQLDVAELNAQEVLEELHADTERLELTRDPRRITVKGIVETDDRKAEIRERLRAIPHVNTAISSYRDLTSKETQNGAATQLQEVSVADSDTPLKNECERRHIAADACRQLSYSVLNSSSVLVRESRRIRDLERQYPIDKPLAKTSLSLLIAIAHERFNRMEAALDEQEMSIRSLGDEPAEKERVSSNPQALSDAAENNLALSKELIYSSNNNMRAASVILHELTASIHITREAIAHDAADFQSRLGSSSVTAAPNQQ